MKATRKKKVLVAMSGGVDSSVTAALLKQQGYEVVGCFMRLGTTDEIEADTDNALDCEGVDTHKPNRQGCCSLNDASDARLVAAKLEIPFYVLNFKKEFGRIINYFVDEYNAGRTPNPCIRCNDWLKFGKLAAYARSIEADYIATGHYARVDRPADSSRPARLLCGRDKKKDQSYFLFGTPRWELERMILPIGDLEKTQVRRIAKELGLRVFDKPDSQEICFVPDNDYARLIQRQTPEQFRSGDILDKEGHPIGRHEGQQCFTIGQRRGVGVALGYPVYVVDKNPEANTVTVGTKQDLLAGGLIADKTNWLVDLPMSEPIVCQAKIRHNSPSVLAVVRLTGPRTLGLQFAQPQASVTPGQAVVCYRDDELIGGGWISKALQRGPDS